MSGTPDGRRWGGWCKRRGGKKRRLPQPARCKHNLSSNDMQVEATW